MGQAGRTNICLGCIALHCIALRTKTRCVLSTLNVGVGAWLKKWDYRNLIDVDVLKEIWAEKQLLLFLKILHIFAKRSENFWTFDLGT